MLEFPEVMARAAQLEKEVAGKKVTAVLPPNKSHKFCWFNGAPNLYEERIKDRRIESVSGFGIFVEILFDNGERLAVNDGVNVRFTDSTKLPKTYQLLIIFDDQTALSFTVAMYGGIILHHGDYDNEYYEKSLHAVSPLSEEFSAYYDRILAEGKPNLSAKAFLATEQRFPGIGNGVVQDILFEAGIHPKRKLNTLSQDDIIKLKESIVTVLEEMLKAGGRDTEKDIYGENCGYQTKMSKNSLTKGCPMCGGEITKEAYLGGSVYYCPKCQPLIK
ncbi:endonuclease VIII [Clostridium sp. AF19-22AC]|uniref:endonuclease VIII n=1 Tax=Clostridia TaxID=186801 RepID=UPI000E4AC383|nr:MULTISPECIES: endonuclease VIII [Clostridia]RHR22898.1 endonuclease VIII [Clostridium sp. AF19-22AC]